MLYKLQIFVIYEFTRIFIKSFIRVNSWTLPDCLVVALKEFVVVRRWIRETAFQIARRDLALFLEEHEDDLLRIFREEMRHLDDQIPEESLFIDIKMVPMGEMFLRAALRALKRFLLLEEGTHVERLEEH